MVQLDLQCRWFDLSFAGFQTQGPVHAWQALYHWTAFPDNRKDLIKILETWYFIESFVLLKRNKLKGANYFPYSLSASMLQTSSSGLLVLCCCWLFRMWTWLLPLCLLYWNSEIQSTHDPHCHNQFPEWPLIFFRSIPLPCIHLLQDLCNFSLYFCDKC